MRQRTLVIAVTTASAVLVGIGALLYQRNANFEKWNLAGGYLKQESPKAVPLFRDLATGGDRKAAAVLAEIYIRGDLARQSDSEAIRWAERSDDPGGLESWYAKAFLAGDEGFPRDANRARLWLARAAAHGDRHAVLLMKSASTSPNSTTRPNS